VTEVLRRMVAAERNGLDPGPACGGGSVLDHAVLAGLEAAAVEARESAGDFIGEEWEVAGGDEEVGNAPEVFLGGHPVLGVEAGEVDGDGVVAEGAFAAQVVVVLEVAEGELAQGAVNGGAEAEAGVVGFGDASPEAAFAVEGDDVIVVADGFEIHEQWRVAVDAEGGGGEECAFEAVAAALAEGSLGRAGGVGVAVGEGVDEALDAGGGVEGMEGAEVLGGGVVFVALLGSSAHVAMILRARNRGRIAQNCHRTSEFARPQLQVRVYSSLMKHKVSRALNSAISAGVLLLASLMPSHVRGQSVTVASFEVASIHPSAPGTAWNFRESGDAMTLVGVTARVLIADAYGMDTPKIVGGPSWIDSTKYDLNAKFDPSVAAKLAPLSPQERMNQILPMLRPVLAERFGLKAHPETREMRAYALVLAKGRPKFSSVPVASGVADQKEVQAKYNGHQWTVNREPMSFLALQLSRIPDIGRNVIDQTGLKGDYKFTFDWSSKTDPDVSVFTALEEQLGLKLEPAKAPVDVFVIDHIEQPSEN
jgi:uncharacterized protein (TIGR03435 family)